MSSHPIADIKSIEDYNKAKSDENIAVILFNDDTVEQCRFMTGVMEELRKDESLKFVQFYKLAAKEMRETEFRELCRNHEVEHVPTVIVLIAGKEEERIDGANAARLSKKVDHYAKKKALETRIKKLISAQKVMLLMRPPKGLLLFGPPGTGKTLIGKCIASQSGSTFFSISASSLTSKWVGEGEKMVRALFAVAKVNQPSVVFIDEIDSLLSSRSDNEHESSRRIKTEFLVQLDGAGPEGGERVLVVGATNRPQELDEAARRRLVKRLYIPLPEAEARKKIIYNLLAKERHEVSEAEVEEVGRQTEGYSGADMANLCKEAALGPIRSLPAGQIQSVRPDQVRPINYKDLQNALRQVKASVSEQDLDLYLDWDKKFGAGK